MSQEHTPLIKQQQERAPSKASSPQKASPKAKSTSPALREHPSTSDSDPKSSEILNSMSATRPATGSSGATSLSGSARLPPGKVLPDDNSEKEVSEAGSLSQGKSPLFAALAKARAKLSRHPSGAESLAGGEEEYERLKAKAIEKQKRRDEYERLGLGDRTKFGMQGAGRWEIG
nr:hypothetical protein CFP56_22242 [Quercus suber]